MGKVETDANAGDIPDISSIYYDVNGVRLHAVKAGESAELIIMLHGFPEFWYSWRHQIRYFSKHYTVIAPDMRGYNLSGKPQYISSYSALTVAKDIVDLIIAAGFGKAIVVGHDWGGAIAWKLAALYPERVSNLVVLNCPHPSIFGKHLKRNFRQMLRSWYILFFQLPYVPELLLGASLKLFFRRTLKGWSYNKNAFSDEDINLYVEAFRKKGAFTAALNYYRASFRNRKKFWGRDNLIQAPTLLIWGENDRALGKNLTVGTEKYISAPYRLEFISDCSHWVQNEYPQRVNELIDEFLKRVY